MNEFKDELIKDIGDMYNSIDFSILPICVQEANDRRTFYDLIFLLKISDFLDYYNEFKKTLAQKTSMNVKILDSNDMIAYMKLNSKIKIAKTDDIKISQEMIKRLYSSKMGEMILMFDEHVEKINMISDIYLETIQKEFDLDAYKLQIINKFLNKVKQLPSEPFFMLISWSQPIKKTSTERLFNKLKFEEKFAIADTIINNIDHEIDPNNNNLLLVCKLLLGNKFGISSDMLRKNIMLGFICYNENYDYIAESIIDDAIFYRDKSPEEYMLRIDKAVRVINSIYVDIDKSAIKNILKEKCLKRLESIKLTVMTLLQRI